jgi:hypothetical protein
MSKVLLTCLTIIISLSLASNATTTMFFHLQQQQDNAFAQTATTVINNNNTAANITLGNPQIIYTEYGKTTNMIPFVVNGTHGSRLSFIGNGTIQGINVTDNGRAISISKADGSIFSRGVGILTANASSRGIAAFSFIGTGHYGTDGKLRDFGPIYFLNATGSLASLKGAAGIYKDQINKAGNAVTKLWLWKQ